MLTVCPFGQSLLRLRKPSNPLYDSSDSIHSRTKEQDIMPKQRVEAFSDGVFAVAITLLVLGFKSPAAAPPNFQKMALALWSPLMAYILSFVIVGVYWVAHHAFFGFVAKTNRSLLWLNNLFLMSIAFLPFPAALLSQFRSSQTVIAPVIAYGMAIIISFFNLVLPLLVFAGVPLFFIIPHRLVEGHVVEMLRSTTSHGSTGEGS
jgi:uncharacterized membrane protein